MRQNFNSTASIFVIAIFLASCADQLTPEQAKAPEPLPMPPATVRLPEVAAFARRAPSREVQRMIAGLDRSHDARLAGYGGEQDRERYQDIIPNPVFLVNETPVSTFSIDVDTASYANARRFLMDGYLPPEDSVRVEEFVNYFNYDYLPPADQETPFAVHWELANTPWNSHTKLLKVGIKGFEIPNEERPKLNLTFLLDVSGSMRSADKLPLVVKSLRLLINQLGEDDTVSIVVYAGAAGVVLDSVPGNDKGALEEALNRLQAGGSTAGGAGIERAYALASKNFIEDGINRVILATDGDFNVGVSDTDKLREIIARKRDTGIFLTTLGFGSGNINDHLMEQLADTGNGNYAYIDSLMEACKVLGKEMASTVITIASDVKIQVEFNPSLVAEYRLIGYENRMLRREDFNNDKIDAGEIGSGHTVTALYELALVGDTGFGNMVDPLRYGAGKVEVENTSDLHADEFGFLKLRYKIPGESKSTLMKFPMMASAIEEADEGSSDLRFAAAVSAFGQYLRGGDYLADFGPADISKLASAGVRGDQPMRSQFVELVGLAADIQGAVRTGISD